MLVDQPRSLCSLDELVMVFAGRLTAKQVMAVYHASGGDFDSSMECLLEGPTLSSILNMLNDQFQQQPRIKVQADLDDIWHELVALYKSPRMDVSKQLRVVLHNQPAVDTGGVRC